MTTKTGHRLIFCLHSVAATMPQQREWQSFWMPMREFVPLYDTVTDRSRSRGYDVELTCDDGYLSHYSSIYPWLMERGLGATFFVPTDNLGKPDHITVSHMREMHAAGLRFGSHGIEHLDWTRATDAERVREIDTGKKILEDLLGAEVTQVAPPYGAYNRQVLRCIKQAGIREVYTCDGGFSTTRGSLRTRVSVQRHAAARSILALSERGGGRYDRIRQIYHNARMLQLS